MKILLIVACLIQFILGAKEKLLFMTQLVRHGARGPILNILPIKWQLERNLNLMELLDAGWRQHYLSGLSIRKNHPDFFKDMTSEEYIVQPTGRQRTVESGIARMSGLFDIFNVLGLEKDSVNWEEVMKQEDGPLKLQEILLKNFQIDYDPIARFGAFRHCKDFIAHHMKDTKDIKKRLLANSPKLKAFSEELRIILKRKTAPTFLEMALMGDEAIGDVYYGKEPFFSSDSEQYKKLVWINSANHFAKFYDKNYMKLYTTPLLRDLAANMLKKYRSHLKLTDEEFPLKYKLYSAHDTTISPILINLGLIDINCIQNQAQFLHDFNCFLAGKPPVGSSLTWELIEVGPKEHYIRTNLNGDYINFCDLKPKDMRKADLESPVRKFDCTMEQFDKRIFHLTHENWSDICKRVDLYKINYWDPIFRHYKKLLFMASFFCIISISFAFRMNRELRILKKWRQHVILDEWSEVENEDLKGLNSESSSNGQNKEAKEKIE